MQRRRMGGRFFVVPYEVDDKLGKIKGEGAWKIYRKILRHAIIEEEGWETDSLWITGRFRASSSSIIKMANMSRATFYRAWPELLESGLVEEKENGFYALPFYKKRGDSPITESQLNAMISRIHSLEDHIGKLTGLVSSLLRKRDSGEGQKSVSQKQTKVSDDETEVSQKQTKVSQKQTKVSQNWGTSSDLDRGIDPVPPPPGPGGPIEEVQEICHSEEEEGGGGGISGSEEEDRQYLIDQLTDKGVYASTAAKLVDKYGGKRILDNIKLVDRERSQGVRFESVGGVLVSRIKKDHAGSQERQGAAKRKKQEEEEETRRLEEEAKREEEERRAGQIEAYRESMSEEDRQKLHDQAVAEIEESGKFKKAFITDLLVKIKENEIIARKIFDESETE